MKVKRPIFQIFQAQRRGVDWGTAKVSPLKALLTISTVCVYCVYESILLLHNDTGLDCVVVMKLVEALFNRQNLLIARLQGVTNAVHNGLT